MINLFLKARHWQLFLLTFGIPFMVQIAMMISLFISLMEEVSEHGMPDPVNMFSSFQIYFPILMILWMGTLFGWFWSVATGLQKLIPEGLRLSMVLFKVFFLFP